MTAKLLSLTKVDGQPLPEAELIRMAPTIRQVAKMLNPVAKKSGISLELELDGDSTVLITRDDLYQIVFNLMENGIKYNRPGGTVTVTAAGHPVLAIFAAMFAGACAGFVTAFLQTKLGVPSILAGIVTNTGLYTVNLMAMGWKSNQSLLGGKTVFTMLRETGIGGEWYELLPAAFVTILAGLLLVLFLGTRMGLSIRATGDNPDMVRASSLNPSFTITVGLCLANMLTALSGAIVGQYQKTVDINSGTGIVVIGLACLIIGETVLGRRSMTRGVLAALVGSLIYRFIYAVVFYTKIVPVECLKLLTAIIVALAIAAPSIQRWAAFQRRKAAAKGKGGN